MKVKIPLFLAQTSVGYSQDFKQIQEKE